jgi:hypothetical protein
MEVEQSVARIESVYTRPEAADVPEVPSADTGDPVATSQQTEPEPFRSDDEAVGEDEDDAAVETAEAELYGAENDADNDADHGADQEEPKDVAESATFTAVSIGGEPVATEHDPWEDYNGSSEGFSERARPGAEKSWGEAEAHLAAMAEEVAAHQPTEIESQGTAEAEAAHEAAHDAVAEGTPSAEPPIPLAVPDVAAEGTPSAEPFVPPPPRAAEVVESEADAAVTAQAEEFDAAAAVAAETDAEQAPYEEAPVPPAAPVAPPPPSEAAAMADEPGDTVTPSLDEPAAAETPEEEPIPVALEQAESDTPREAMMDFGTLELVDPESVWAEGAEDFAPWFLAHSRQLGDVLGLESGLSDARQFTTKSATGVLGRDDNGEDVVVVSSQKAVADDSDLGRALGMAASSGAASVALVSAALNDDQLKALAWLNNQTKSGVRWYGIEMRVVRIADSPAAMLFDLVAAPPGQ